MTGAGMGMAALLAAALAVLAFRRDTFNPPWWAAGVALLRAGTFLAAALALGWSLFLPRPSPASRPSSPPTAVLAEERVLADPAGRARVAAILAREVGRDPATRLLAYGGDGRSPAGSGQVRFRWQGEPVPLFPDLATARLRARWEGGREVEASTAPPPVFSSLAVPPIVFAGVPFAVRAALPSPPSGARIHLLADGRSVGVSPPRATLPGGGAEADFTLSLKEKGAHRLRFEARDGAGNLLDARGAEVAARGRPRVFFVSPTPGLAPLLDLWESRGMTILRFPSTALPTPLSRAGAGDLVVLDALPPDALTAAAAPAAAAVMERGATLLLLTGSGVWARDIPESAIAGLLPMRFDLEPGEKKDRTLALVAVVDTSMSMYFPQEGGDPTPKIGLAMRALRNLSDALPVRDRLGILGVDFSPYWVVSPARPRDRAREAEVIAKLKAFSGGINLYSGLLAAYREISAVAADHRHILVMADSADIDEYIVTGQGTVWDLTRQMALEGITVSVIAFGNPTDKNVPLLARVAEEGGGYIYVAREGTDVPDFTLRDFGRIADRQPVDRRPRVLWSAADFPTLDRLPPVEGQVRASPRAGAALWTWSESGYALLAGWRLGKGAVAVFASDAGRALARGWTGKEQGPLWDLLLPPLLPGEADPAPLFARRADGEVTLALRAPSGAPPPEVAFLRQGAPEARSLPHETAPGEFQLSFPDPAGGRALLEAAGAVLDLPGNAGPMEDEAGTAARREEAPPPRADSAYPLLFLPLLMLAAAGGLVLDEIFRGP